jgi:hypothetical protein
MFHSIAVAFGLLVRYRKISGPKERLRPLEYQQDKVKHKKLKIQERMEEVRAANLARKSGKGYKK